MQPLVIFVFFVLIIVSIIVLINLSNIIKLFNKKDPPGQTTPGQTTPGRYNLVFEIADDIIETILPQGTTGVFVFPELTDEQMQVLSHVFEPILHPTGVYCQSEVIGMIQPSFDLSNPKHLVLERIIDRTKRFQEEFRKSKYEEDFEWPITLTLAEDIIKVRSEMNDVQENKQVTEIQRLNRELFNGELPVFPSDIDIINKVRGNEVDDFKEHFKKKYCWWKTLINTFTGKNSAMEDEYRKSTNYWKGYEESAFFLEPDDPDFLVPEVVNREIYWLQRSNFLPDEYGTFFADHQLR